MSWLDCTDYTTRKNRQPSSFSLYLSHHVRLRIDCVKQTWFLTCTDIDIDGLQLAGATLREAQLDAIKVAAMHLRSRIHDYQAAEDALLRERRRHAHTKRTRKPSPIDKTGLHRAVKEACEDDEDE